MVLFVVGLRVEADDKDPSLRFGFGFLWGGHVWFEVQCFEGIYCFGESWFEVSVEMESVFSGSADEITGDKVDIQSKLYCKF